MGSKDRYIYLESMSRVCSNEVLPRAIKVNATVSLRDLEKVRNIYNKRGRTVYFVYKEIDQ